MTNNNNYNYYISPFAPIDCITITGFEGHIIDEDLAKHLAEQESVIDYESGLAEYNAWLKDNCPF